MRVVQGAPLRSAGSQTSVNVTTSATELVAAKPKRIYILIQVLGSNDVYITFDGTDPVVAGTNGEILLKGDSGSGGGSFSPQAWVPTGQIKAIASGGNSRVSVIEA